MPSLFEPWVFVWIVSAAAGLGLSLIGLGGAWEDRLLLRASGLNGALRYVAGVHVRSWWARVTIQALSLAIASLVASIPPTTLPATANAGALWRLELVRTGLALVSIVALAWAAQDLAARRRHLAPSSH